VKATHPKELTKTGSREKEHQGRTGTKNNGGIKIDLFITIL